MIYLNEKKAPGNPGSFFVLDQFKIGRHQISSAGIYRFNNSGVIRIFS